MVQSAFVAVVMDFQIRWHDDEGRTIDEDEKLLRQLLSNTPPIQLRELTKVRYQPIDYRIVPRFGGRVVAGVIEQQRETSVSPTRQSQRGFVTGGPSEDVRTRESTTEYVINLERGIIVYREKSWLPSSKVMSIIGRAMEHHEIEDAEIALVPRRRKVKIREAIESMDSVSHLRTHFRHSQSPGNPAIDRMLERARAKLATYILETSEGESLDKEAILDKTTEMGRSIDHLDQNRSNGSALVVGKVGDDRFKFDTKQNVDRRILHPSGDGVDGVWYEMEYLSEVVGPPQPYEEEDE